MHTTVTTRAQSTSTLIAISVFALSLIFVAGSVPSARVAAQTSTTKDVVFGPVRTYTHKSGWFSVVMPGNWNVTDNSGADEVIVSIIDPTENGVMVVRAFQPTRGYTQAELGEMLKTFLNERMKSFDGFTMGDLKPQTDGSLGLYFKYNSVLESGKYKMYGDAFIEQHNGLIGLVTLIMPEDQYQTKQKAAYELINSFRVMGRAP